MERRPLSRQAKRWLRRRGLLPEEISHESRLRWQDAVALLCIPLAIAGLVLEDTVFVAACFLLSAGVLSFSIGTNNRIRLALRIIIVSIIIIGFGGLTVYVRNKNIKKVLDQNEGFLEPGNKESPDLSDACGNQVPSDAYVFLFGSNIDWTTHRPHAAITVGNGLLSLSIREDGNASISKLKIFDDRNDMVARIEQNKLWVNPGSRRERATPSTLTVFDHLDREVLHIEFLNRKAIKLRGVFRYPRTAPIIITDDFANIRGSVIQRSCVGEALATGFLIN